MLTFTLVSSPIEQNHKPGEANEDLAIDIEMYQRLVGTIIYLAHRRLDIAYAMSMII